MNALFSQRKTNRFLKIKSWLDIFQFKEGLAESLELSNLKKGIDILWVKGILLSLPIILSIIATQTYLQYWWCKHIVFIYLLWIKKKLRCKCNGHNYIGVKSKVGCYFSFSEKEKWIILTVVVAGSFFVKGGFSAIDGPTHLRVIAANQRE